ncbi:voltage-gated hydrogen channel-like [Tropilaelaps mercedesae]|uniref:Voltage-gated hydrogen channel-like n=1 Tax=Tropilaelaps mercedesae TaxID=418985 RepID=A0A1V9Y2E6_9ACAR|nr:voltage-gated hydrogen channel-like [Tropilaelaps mercedesae]
MCVYNETHVFDACTVIVSLVLDIGFYDPESAAFVGSGLIIVLRLWRIARILNGERLE